MHFLYFRKEQAEGYKQSNASLRRGESILFYCLAKSTRHWKKIGVGD